VTVPIVVLAVVVLPLGDPSSASPLPRTGHEGDAAMVTALVPQPQRVSFGDGELLLPSGLGPVRVPAGPEHEGTRVVLRQAMVAAGVEPLLVEGDGGGFTIGDAPEVSPLPTVRYQEQAYVLRVAPSGIAAQAGSPVGLLYAAETVSQLLRMATPAGRLPCMEVVDYPEVGLRGIYIEGGQERFGRIVEADYLCEQIRRLAEFRMNVLGIECYNLFPLPSLPSCADEGTLTPDECQQVMAEAKRYHVTIIPSLQTLAQAYELFWTSDAGVAYREITAPGLTCPSNPNVYPVIKGLYRDLLMLFDDSPFIGIGCSEIDMQWQGRYCPRCATRVQAGETVRDLLLGHAERCIREVHEVASELGRPVRPMVWGDEFYMYGPGRDWVGIDRIPRDTVMGFWKYWRDYAGIGGLMERGFDVFGVSAMYNHTFYLADLSPEDPPKSWPSMEQTGTLNITELAAEGVRAEQAPSSSGRFLGVVTASFSKHRLRAFDSIWYGLALNGQCSWSRPDRSVGDYQDDYTRGFAWHYYDARTPRAAATLHDAYVRLDRCKSGLERTNQTLHDVVGVVDTQEAGYIGNSLLGAMATCSELAVGGDQLREIRERAMAIASEASALRDAIDTLRPEVGRRAELGDLWLPAEKIAAHAERQVLMVDTARLLRRGDNLASDGGRAALRETAGRWEAHDARLSAIRARSASLYSRGDPLGLLALGRDVGQIRDHLERLAEGRDVSAAGADADVAVDERFSEPLTDRWTVLGDPRVAEGALETRAPGGWERYCGVITAEPFALEDERPLVVEFDIVPVEMGVDSPLFASTEGTGISYRFALAGARDRFVADTRLSERPRTAWVGGDAGWSVRSASPVIEAGREYHVRAEITRTTFRVTVARPDGGRWALPLWDTLTIPMDPLDATRLVFADVEPEGATAASRWSSIRIWRPKR